MAKKPVTPASKVAAKQAAVRSRHQEDVFTLDPLIDQYFKGRIAFVFGNRTFSSVLKKD